LYQPLDSILSHINPVHKGNKYLLQTRVNVTFNKVTVLKLSPSDCRDKTDVKEQPASTAYWLNVSAGTVERPGSDDRCPYSQGLAGYVVNTSIVNSEYNRLPVITYISLAQISSYV
jgi:hypothetical protein